MVIRPTDRDAVKSKGLFSYAKYNTNALSQMMTLYIMISLVVLATYHLLAGLPLILFFQTFSSQLKSHGMNKLAHPLITTSTQKDIQNRFGDSFLIQ